MSKHQIQPEARVEHASGLMLDGMAEPVLRDQILNRELGKRKLKVPFLFQFACLKKNQSAPRPSEHPPVMGGKMSKRCLKKNQSTPRPSEHPPVMGGKMSKRLGGIKGCKYQTSSWHLNRFPDADNIGSTV